MKAKARHYYLLLFLFGLSACQGDRQPLGNAGAQDKPCRIEGRIEGGGRLEIIVEEMTARELIPVDTCYCDENGAFESTFDVGRESFYVLRFGDEMLTLLISPGESLKLNTNLARPGYFRVEGSPASSLLAELSARHKATLEELAKLSRRSRDLRNEAGYPELKRELDRQFDSLTGSFHDYSKGFIESNLPSQATLIALYNLYGPGLPVFDPASDLELYQRVDSVLLEHHPEVEAVQLLHSQLAEALQMLKTSASGTGPKAGEIAPDFVSSQPDGSALALSDLRGRYVLLSFWASWSEPSRIENARLARLGKRFGGNAFSIVQLALDDDREDWLSAIEEDAVPALQLSDLQRWACPAVELYRLERIPSNLLIDPEGRIVASDLFGKELEEKLEQLFK